MVDATRYDLSKDLFENQKSKNREDLLGMDIDENIASVSRWTEDNPAISSKRIDSLVYFTDKLSRIDGVISNKTNFLKLLFWFFGLDDVFDNGNATITDLQFLVKSFQNKDNIKNIQDPHTRETASNLVHIFEEVIEEMSLPDEGKDLVYYCLRKTLHGMLLEAKNSFDDFDKYLHFGKYTSGIPLLFATQFFTDEFSLKHKSSIMQHLETAGEIIRIYNDIKSYNREIGEGKNNSIGILTGNHMEFNDALCMLDFLANIRLDILKTADEDNSSLSMYIDFLLKMIDGIKTFYQSFDFHEFKIESLSSDSLPSESLPSDRTEWLNHKVSFVR